ncbi:MAG: HlyD family efflux transporter periplasmic adaptor subunit [Arcobacteraceae bacterium]|nr:HlyD family efflux transporter periplasmic adaptor subunit [Arcobacteraceae bacterium]
MKLFKSFFILLLIVGVGGYIYFNFPLNKPKELSFSGQIDSKSAYVGSKFGGRIKAIYKNEGDSVKKGEDLIVLDSDSQKLQIALLETKYNQAKITLRKLKNGYQKEEIESAKADLDLKSAVLNNAKVNFERQKILFASGVGTSKDYDDTQSIYLQAKAQKEVSAKKLELLSGGYRDEDKSLAKESIKEIEANLNLAKLNLKESIIKASSDGIVQNISAQIGDLINPNQAIVQIDLEDEKYAKFYVSQTKLNLISLGQKVYITIDNSTTKYEGEVFYISQSAEFTPKNIATKDDRDNLLFAVKAKVKDAILKNGMIIEVFLK